jgi:hypothetical protein
VWADRITDHCSIGLRCSDHYYAALRFAPGVISNCCFFLWGERGEEEECDFCPRGT